ncbi:MAG: hypothetical protein QOG36_339 [Actinomycetota bacterium]|nr:hypothetical protein [Actinomycetota bacterium]
MNANGQDVLEPKLKTEGSAVVTGVMTATRVESAAGQVAAVAGEAVERRAPLENDVWIYRMVVGVLGAVLIIATLGGLIIAMAGKAAIPEMVVALGSGAAGALAGLLAPSPAGRQ